MTTALEKTLKRALAIKGQPYVLAVSPLGLKLTPKGKRNGVELEWESLVSGEAALAVALNASLGRAAVPEPIATAGKSRPEMSKDRPRRRRA
jgi:hypothetical protein